MWTNKGLSYLILSHLISSHLILSYLPVHQQLHLQSAVCRAPEVCRWHNPHWTYLWWGWVCLQVADWPIGVPVQAEQPGAQCSQNSGDGGGLQEEPHLTKPHPALSPCVTPQSPLWSPSTSWRPSSPRTWSGSRTSAPSAKKHSSGCTSCGSWGTLARQRQWWCTSTWLLLLPLTSYTFTILLHRSDNIDSYRQKWGTVERCWSCRMIHHW